MERAEGGVRIQIGKQIGMQPFRQRLDSHKLVRAVVELMPDGVDIAVVRHRQGFKSIAHHQLLKTRGSLGDIGTRTDADPFAHGIVILPVSAGHHHHIRLAGDNLFRVNGAEGARDQIFSDVTTARNLDHLTKVLIAKRHAALVAVAACTVNHHFRAVAGKVLQTRGDKVNLLLAEGDNFLGTRRFVHQFAHDADTFLRIHHRRFAEIDKHHRHAYCLQFFNQLAFIGGGFRFQIHQHQIGLQG